MITERLENLRDILRERDIDWYIITGDDPHGSEYPALRWRTREFISGFTGSAGTVMISQDRALLWTDSRYFIQAEKELEGTGFELMKEGMDGVPTLSGFLESIAEKGMRVGIVVVVMLVALAVFVSARENVDALRVVEYLHVRIVLLQFVHPRQLEPDVAYLEVGDALAQMHEVRRRGVVCLGIAAGRHDAVDVETIAGDLLGKILLGLYGYSDNLLFFVPSRARYGYECEQYTCTICQKWMFLHNKTFCLTAHFCTKIV